MKSQSKELLDIAFVTQKLLGDLDNRYYFVYIDSYILI